MRRVLISSLLAIQALGAQSAIAQTPFSMSPGAPSPPPAAQPAPQQQPAQQAPSTAPFEMRQQGAAPSGPSTAVPAAPSQSAPPSAGAPPFNVAPQRPAPPAQAGSPAPARPAAGAAAARSPTRIERPILPFETVRLEGETDARSWTVHLTQDEASSGASIALGYKNAVVVMPEGSRLRIAINGEPVVDTPISSSSDIKRLTASIRPGLLRAGQNIIRMEAFQRHRTDCTVDATYELWTDVDSASTKLVFAEGATKTLRGLDDLPAVGVDNAGVTTIRVVAPKIYRPEIRDRLLRLVQLVALRGRYAHPVIQVVESDPGPSPVGTIKVAMGLASELRGLVTGVPDAASIQPLTMMMQEPGSLGSTLVVSGPTWQDLDTAIGIVGTRGLGVSQAERGMIDTASWQWPEVPTAFGAQSFRFADLGVPTQEFSGRRLKVGFSINLPPDFYATEYGETILHLDAAYTSAVRPGSHVNVFVNGMISTQMTITSQGDIVKRYNVRVPLKNFKAGLNHITVEAALLTDADERCTPGETLSETNRFVLFDTTTLEFPTYGRIGRLPDLAVLSSGRFPDEDLPTTVVLARPDPLNYSAAGTLLASMARSAGAPVRAQFANAASADDESVLFIGAVDQIPAGLLNRVKVSEHLRMIWPSTPTAGDRTGPQAANTDFSLPAPQGSPDRMAAASTDEVRKRWSETFQRRGVFQQTIGTVQDWMEKTFSLSLKSLSLNERTDAPYEPPQRASLLVAQSRTDASGVWTLVTARTDKALADETARLANPMIWSQVAGRAVALDPRETKLQVEPIKEYRFVQTQPPSLSNLRLVAANWMSANILPYALLMLACCTFLGIATSLLLNRLGRHS
ncbi:cellulose biosynthesis cyclic di-GMP-binding regulatory protein BcsB [Microvirga lotononidis]|uniref:Cyclic di-GMP-binding protein n=1 Tax=Microvirga lotononidis TaxID=864069 RepID=I4YT32_9HYPH|nr:cellulose biosynthesis cyclic di-GMP-binding regulatory protein BcsB [Microvirga lotononidis]EIM27124.1 Bacterial cellulose synthase subunit [Microvirga lotononidis]WQO28688.1 cellulose biosynthesis cyclic di-GMP-binding regulatory protein BcsB [Microvirga lotononidis]